MDTVSQAGFRSFTRSISSSHTTLVNEIPLVQFYKPGNKPREGKKKKSARSHSRGEAIWGDISLTSSEDRKMTPRSETGRKEKRDRGSRIIAGGASAPRGQGRWRGLGSLCLGWGAPS